MPSPTPSPCHWESFSARYARDTNPQRPPPEPSRPTATRTGQRARTSVLDSDSCRRPVTSSRGPGGGCLDGGRVSWHFSLRHLPKVRPFPAPTYRWRGPRACGEICPMPFSPTDEQAAALEAFRSGSHLAIQAGCRHRKNVHARLSRGADAAAAWALPRLQSRHRSGRRHPFSVDGPVQDGPLTGLRRPRTPLPRPPQRPSAARLADRAGPGPARPCRYRPGGADRRQRSPTPPCGR